MNPARVGVHLRQDIVEIVLGARRPAPRHHGIVAAATAVAVCALPVLSALQVEPRRGSRPVAAARVPIEISLDQAVAPIEQARPPEPSPAPEPVRVAPSRRFAPPTPSRAAVPPAQAAAVVVRESPPNAPVDMTGETFVVGSGPGYAGGVTAASGTSTIPAQGRGPSVGTGPAGPRSGDGAAFGRTDRSAPVVLASQSWSCPWPAEADPLPLDEETVVIRVVVRPDGTAESVAVVADPGHGFGEAAATCARRTTFVPARAPDGQLVRATSPPIRVRFTRQ